MTATPDQLADIVHEFMNAAPVPEGEQSDQDAAPDASSSEKQKATESKRTSRDDEPDHYG